MGLKNPVSHLWSGFKSPEILEMQVHQMFILSIFIFDKLFKILRTFLRYLLTFEIFNFFGFLFQFKNAIPGQLKLLKYIIIFYTHDIFKCNFLANCWLINPL